MSIHIRQQVTIVGMIGFVFMWSLIAACGDPARVKPDPSFEKWREKAENSKGYLPTKKKHAVEYSHKKEKQVVAGSEPLATARKLPSRRITLKLQDTSVNTILRALARSVDLNIIINENVSGNATINVKNARWDQLFAGLLRSYGLTYTWEGELLRVMTLEDMERDLKRASQTHDLKLVQPLQTHIVSINYADEHKLKTNLEKFLSATKDGQPIGSIMVDEHTRSLIIKAIEDDMSQLLPLIDELDRPIAQVLIEAHIVEASAEVARQLGVQWGGLASKQGKTNHFITAGANSSGVIGGDLGTAVNPTSGMVANFPADLTGGSGFTIGYVAEKMGENLLTVQLSALQEDGKLNILSSPSITTIDNQVATIEAGTNVPYQTVSKEGNINIEWKEAVLKLEVKPNVIDKETVKLVIRTNKDELDFTSSVAGNPTIITKKAATSVILMDGQTTVIGGLNKETKQGEDTGVPWLQDIPVVGYIFQGNSRSNKMEDILIFITPRILKDEAPEDTAMKADTGDADRGGETLSASAADAVPAAGTAAPAPAVADPPVVLGQIAAASKETLWEMIRHVYGAYRPSLEDAVLNVNPHIPSPEKLQAGQVVYFPAVPAQLTGVDRTSWWIEVARLADLATAYRYVRDNPDSYPPIRLLPHWDRKNGLQFSILLQTYYFDPETAAEQMAELPAGQFGRAELVSNWNGGALLYADPYLVVK